MKHYMKLQDDPFKKIKNKTKTIEMRLNDEKKENKTGWFNRIYKYKI